MNRRGFTLVELIMVIVLLGILAAVAIPKYVNLANEAKQAAEDGVVAAVRAALAIYYAEDLARGGSGIYPRDLEDVQRSRARGDGGGSQNKLFAGVLQEGLTKDKDQWEETSANKYTGPAGGEYTYTPDAGKFE
jgi:prepilin-type N-terminal cleavage/methylation domain-containing protein